MGMSTAACMDFIFKIELDGEFRWVKRPDDVASIDELGIELLRELGGDLIQDF